MECDNRKANIKMRAKHNAAASIVGELRQEKAIWNRRSFNGKAGDARSADAVDDASVAIAS